MLKYTDTEVTFAEIPDEITLCINISNCPCHCKGCHSPYLAEDIGEYLGYITLKELISQNKGISCISFMGGDKEPEWIASLAFKIRRDYPKLKVGWYSGKQELPDHFPIKHFDYIKLGPYIEDLGPLNNPNTNQRFYEVINGKLVDKTSKFWKNEN